MLLAELEPSHCLWKCWMQAVLLYFFLNHSCGLRKQNMFCCMLGITAVLEVEVLPLLHVLLRSRCLCSRPGAAGCSQAVRGWDVPWGAGGSVCPQLPFLTCLHGGMGTSLARKMVFDTPEEDPNYNPLPEDRLENQAGDQDLNQQPPQ